MIGMIETERLAGHSMCPAMVKSFDGGQPPVGAAFAQREHEQEHARGDQTAPGTSSFAWRRCARDVAAS